MRVRSWDLREITGDGENGDPPRIIQHVEKNTKLVPKVWKAAATCEYKARVVNGNECHRVMQQNTDTMQMQYHHVSTYLSLTSPRSHLPVRMPA
jgi:hypothetical protein